MTRRDFILLTCAAGVTTVLPAFGRRRWVPPASGAPPIPYAADLLFAFTPTSGFFSNAAGTTPVTADGDPVLLWTDNSGNGNALRQDTTLNQFTLKTGQLPNGKGCLRGNGLTAYYSLINPVLMAERTNFFLGKFPGVGVSTMTNGSDGSLDHRVDTNVQRLVENNTADVGSGTTMITANTWVQLNASWDFTDGIFRTNRAPDTTVTLANSCYPATRYFGANVPSGTEFFLTDIAYILSYGRVLTTTERQNVETWIAYDSGT